MKKVVVGGCKINTEGELCSCSCHKARVGVVKHCVACCWGECPICGNFIKFGFIQGHLQRCVRSFNRVVEAS